MKDEELDKDRDQVCDREHNDNETILMALDQISQTIDVMTSVVGRLRHFVEEQDVSEQALRKEDLHPNRILH